MLDVCLNLMIRKLGQSRQKIKGANLVVKKRIIILLSGLINNLKTLSIARISLTGGNKRKRFKNIHNHHKAPN